jgi:polyhydroxybutyrate depolymerase
MGIERVRRRGRLTMLVVRLAMVAALALIALTASVLPSPRTAHPAPSASPPAPVAYGASTLPHAGCDNVPQSGDLDLSVPVRGQVRPVLVHLPAGYTAARPVPLLLSLHGSGSTGTKQEAGTGLDATADEHGFIVAYPQGERPNSTGYAWNIPSTPTFSASGPDDAGFLTALMTVLRHEFCVDPSRVYASGFSGGARMVSQLACIAGARLAGIVAAGGVRAPAPCQAVHPVPVLAFHGTADVSNPFNGHGQPYWTYSVPEAMARWARFDACPAQPRTGHPYPGVTETDYRDCADGAEVTLYALTGKGHRWPLPAGAFQPNEIAWRFLSAHSLPAAVPA